MTRGDLVAALSHKMGESKSRMSIYVDAREDVLTGELYRRGEILLPGLGRLAVVDRAPRVGRNPQTGRPIEISATKSVKLRLSKSLKQILLLKQGGIDAPDAKKK
jgi:DNA-binding protein HU-beta